MLSKLIRYLSVIIFVLTYFGMVACASQLFCDSSGILHAIGKGNYFFSSDFGDTWARSICKLSSNEAVYKIVENSDKSNYVFWKENGSLFYNELGSKKHPKLIYKSFFPDKYFVYMLNGSINLIYKNGKNIYFTLSRDMGNTFSQEQILNLTYSADGFSCLPINGQIEVFFSSGGNIYRVDCLSSGSISAPIDIYTSSSNIVGFIDFKHPFRPNYFEMFWVEKDYSGRQSIKYLSDKCTMPKEVYSSQGTILSAEVFSCENSDILKFAEDNAGPSILLKISKDGSHICQPNKLTDIFSTNIEPTDVILNKGSLYAFSPDGPKYARYNLTTSIPTIFSPPIIHITCPSNESYFKSGATIFIKAYVEDKNMDIFDMAEPNITFDGITADASLSYNSEEKCISGFLTLPLILSEGRHRIKITMEDIEDNSGFDVINCNIDNTPPKILKDKALISDDYLSISVFEAGSGIDPGKLALKVYSGSAEIYGKTVIENSNIIFSFEKSLSTESYTISLECADRAGNLCSKEAFSVKMGPISASSFVNDSGLSTSILNALCGPNPFNPRIGQESFIKYDLSAPAEINLVIYSMLGEIVCKKSKSSVNASDSISWDGRDSLGQLVESGVYPYIISLKNDQKEFNRGKIIVLK